MSDNDSQFDNNNYYGDRPTVKDTGPEYFQETPGCEVDLRSLDEAYEEAEVDDANFKDVPDGKYQVEVEKVDLRHSKNSGVPMLAWEMRVLGPKLAGRKLWRNNLLKTKDNIQWLKKDLMLCGLELPRLSALPLHMKHLIGLRLEVTVRSLDGYTNVYLSKKLLTPPQPKGDVPF